MKHYHWRAVVVLALGAGLVAPLAGAFPFRGDVQRLRQPDGSYLNVRVWGDEYYQRVESLDGYTLVRDPKSKVVCYARLSGDGARLVSTGITAHEQAGTKLSVPKGIKESPAVIHEAVQTRAEQLWGKKNSAKVLAHPEGWVRPTQGNVKGITLIIDFPDEPGVITPGKVKLFLNYAGYNLDGNTGSVYDYYVAVSNGQLRFTNWSPDAYYTAQHEKAYYDDPGTPDTPGARGLILEALNYYEAHGFDFSRYDSNQDGYIDGISCMMVGSSASGWGAGLTPHAGVLPGFEADGVKSVNYQITPMFDKLNMAMFVHECGHMLFGWPDLYDHDFDATGLGEYCMMSYGTYPGDPVHVCAYLKEDAGWSQIVPVTASAENLSLAHPAFKAYKFSHPYNPREYFLIENRQRRLRDTRIWDSGLMILHVDQDGSNRWNQMTPEAHYEVSIEQADGRFDLEHNVNRGDETDLYSAPSARSWNPDTTPGTKWWDGSESDVAVYNIGYSGTVMTFSVSLVPKVLPVEPVLLSGDPMYGETPLESVFHFTNPQEAADSWRVSADVPWLAFDPPAGTLAAGETADITARIEPGAFLESPDGYPATVRFELMDAAKFWNRRITFTYVDQAPATADTDKDWIISLSELLLGIQLYQSPSYQCAPDTPDGYAPGPGTNFECRPYSADYSPQDWVVGLSELLRLIQLYNWGGYHRAPDMEDGFALGPS